MVQNVFFSGNCKFFNCINILFNAKSLYTEESLKICHIFSSLFWKICKIGKICRWSTREMLHKIFNYWKEIKVHITGYSTSKYFLKVFQIRNCFYWFFECSLQEIILTNLRIFSFILLQLCFGFFVNWISHILSMHN